MSIFHRHKNLRFLLLSLVAAGLLAFGLYIKASQIQTSFDDFFYPKKKPAATSQDQSTTPPGATAATGSGAGTGEQAVNPGNAAKTEISQQQTPPPTPGFDLSIATAYQNSAKNQVIVNALITGITGTPSGTCQLTLSQSGLANITGSPSIILQDDGKYACRFQVPVSATSGTWRATVSASNGGQVSNTDEKDVQNL